MGRSGPLGGGLVTLPNEGAAATLEKPKTRTTMSQLMRKLHPHLWGWSLRWLGVKFVLSGKKKVNRLTISRFPFPRMIHETSGPRGASPTHRRNERLKKHRGSQWRTPAKITSRLSSFREQKHFQDGCGCFSALAQRAGGKHDETHR